MLFYNLFFMHIMHITFIFVVADIDSVVESFERMCAHANS
jgi:hypothetical protein